MYLYYSDKTLLCLAESELSMSVLAIVEDGDRTVYKQTQGEDIEPIGPSFIDALILVLKSH